MDFNEKIKIEENWVEVFSFLLLFIGFIIAVLLKNPVMNCIIVFLAGTLAGRSYFLRKEGEILVPFLLIMLGFLVGYIVGSIWVSRILIIIFFVLGFIVSYYLHLKEILVIFKSKNFIK